MIDSEPTSQPWLSASELVGLTGKHRRSLQRGELVALGIPFRSRTDGSVVVLRADLCSNDSGAPKVREFKPDLSAI